MFDRGVNALLVHLPTIGTVDAAVSRRLLTGAFLEMVAVRDLGAQFEQTSRASDLRRLATALELHAVLAPTISEETRRACAFVAAEALEIHRELVVQDDATPTEYVEGLDVIAYAAIEAAALYIVAGYDANAAVTSRTLREVTIDENLPERISLGYTLRAIRAFFELRAAPQGEPGEPPEALPLASQVRWELWRQIARCVSDQTAWLRLEPGAPIDAGDRLRALSERLIEAQRHLDISLVAALLARASDGMSSRALRSTPHEGGGAVWGAYVAQRATQRPLLWPAAQEFARAALPGPHASAVVTVPTGGGKTEVAELAIAQAVADGWVLYLAPTNALVAQILRDLEVRFSGAPDLRIRGFLGGAEYTELEGETLGDVDEPQVVVMTPEKCSLALRQSPEAFESLRLFVMDECHLLGDPGTRGVIAELVATEIALRAPNASIVMLSALVANADELAAWLSQSTGRATIAIRESWRPTRTVRAVLGIDPAGATEASGPAAETFARYPQRRTARFEAPVSVIANLQGAWTTIDAEDYMVIPTDLTAPLTARRRDDGQIGVDPTGYVNVMSGRLTHQLASRGHRVLTFLPASKHHSFSVARDLESLTPRPRQNARLTQVAAHLDLADYELGVPSVLRDLIDKAVAVHTSAMVRDEQRASEIAFADGQAIALFATGTLAQGLNLPATAVVVGGTRVGHDPHLQQAIREERTRAQLLNAIGRAGRAYVASRSLGVVIPDRWVLLPPDGAATAPRTRAPFLAYDDASTTVRSQIESLIQGALSAGMLTVGALSEQEQTAFSFLSLASADDSREIVRRSFGAHRLGIGQDVERAGNVASSIRTAGSLFMEETGAPQWVRQASNASGMSLPSTAALYRTATPQLANEAPDSLAGWREVLLASVSGLTPALTRLALPAHAFDSTPIAPLFQDDATHAEREAATQSLSSLLAAWMDGLPLGAIAEAILGEAEDMSERGQGKPLPKIISLLDQGVAFGMARAAGVLAAFGATATEQDPEDAWALDGGARRMLDVLPIAVRFGCNDLPSVAWYRWGVRRRRLAHLLADRFPPPAGIEGSELSGWIATQHRRLVEEADDIEEFDEQLASLVDALRLVQRI